MSPAPMVRRISPGRRRSEEHLRVQGQVANIGDGRVTLALDPREQVPSGDAGQSRLSGAVNIGNKHLAWLPRKPGRIPSAGPWCGCSGGAEKPPPGGAPERPGPGRRASWQSRWGGGRSRPSPGCPGPRPSPGSGGESAPGRRAPLARLKREGPGGRPLRRPPAN